MKQFLDLSKAIVVLGGVILPVAAALAGNWNNENSVSVAAQYNDNPTLLPDSSNPRSTETLVATLNSDFAFEEPTRSFTFSPRIQGVYYPDRDFSNLDRLEAFFRGNATFITERTSWGASASFSSQSILSAEDSDPEDPDNAGDGNFFRVDDTRDSYSISPFFRWTVSELDQLTLGVGYSEVDHELERTNRADFENTNVALGYTRRIDQRQSIGVSATRFDGKSERLGFVCLSTPCFPVDAKFENDSVSDDLSVNYSYLTGKKSELNASIGRGKTESTNRTTIPGQSISSTSTSKGTRFKVGASTAGELWKLDANISRRVSPNSNGTPSDRTQLQSAFDYRFTEKLTGRLALIAYEQNNATENTTLKNKFFRVDTSMGWRLSRELVTSFVYTYRDRDPDTTILGVNPNPNFNTSEKRKSNAIGVSLRYEFRGPF